MEIRPLIVHERFTELGGSELVVEQLHALYPNARVATTLLDPAALPEGLREVTIDPSPLQRLYRGGSTYAPFLPAFPLAMRFIDTSVADVVLMSHHAFANRVRTHPDIPTVCYTHTPARWIWDSDMLRDEIGGWLGRHALALFSRTQRPLDRRAAQRIDIVLANSRHVAARIRRWWGRDAQVVPPPVNVDRFRLAEVPRENFFLYAGRLAPYKRPHVAVAAARRAGVRLVVAGEGRLRPMLEEIRGPGIELLGRVDDAVMVELLQRCAALVFPGEEDFGIVPVEAQACGAPVIARAVGGVLDTVIDGTTGMLYDVPGGTAATIDDEVNALAQALQRFDASVYRLRHLRENAERFSVEEFGRRMRSVVEALVERQRSGGEATQAPRSR